MSMSPLLPVDDVISRLVELATPITETESVPLTEGLGRVLAADLHSAVNVPPAANSSMDGYAVSTAGQGLVEGEVLPVSDRIAAGHVGHPLQPGTAARIFTGAPLPEGADAVVIQEDTETLDENRIRVMAVPRPGENVRPAGQDILAGRLLLSKGRRLRPQDLALAASVGVDRLTVYRPLRVALISTGDELVDPPAALAPGQIYNSNHYALIGLVRALGMEVIDAGLVADDYEATRAALASAAERADCIISSGGVSVGEEDHVRAALEELGELTMWRIAIKPGKPLAYGRVGNTPFFGLPGNPVSTFVTFTMIATPWLRKTQGMADVLPAHLWATARFDMPAGSRREYVRVQVQATAAGDLEAHSYPEQGSGVMSSVSWANALAEVDIDQEVRYGDRLRIYLLKD